MEKEELLKLMTNVAAVTLMSFFVTGLVEFFIRPIYEKTFLINYSWTLIYWSFIFGQLCAFLMGLNLFVSISNSWLGFFITGGVIGRGASFMWDLLDRQNFTVMGSLRR